MPTDSADPVNHPAHYGGEDDPYEAIKVIEAWELGFHLGNTLKYIRRRHDGTWTERYFGQTTGTYLLLSSSARKIVPPCCRCWFSTCSATSSGNSCLVASPRGRYILV